MTAGPLDDIWAKSSRREGDPGQTLCQHSIQTLAAARTIRRRVGPVVGLDDQFWAAVEAAALLHDAGKLARPFQAVLGNPTAGAEPWARQRHEVLSLGVIDPLCAATFTPDQQRLTSAAVATHHRSLLTPAAGDQKSLQSLYSSHVTDDRVPVVAADRVAELVGVPADRFTEFCLWAEEQLPGLLFAADQDAGCMERVANRLADLLAVYAVPVTETSGPLRAGLREVLAQGVVTWSDHAASGEVRLHTHLALPNDILGPVADAGHTVRHHQAAAGEHVGHLIQVAPTGSGKTEGMLAWAATQVADLERLGGEPRVFYCLPYLASINAMADRLRRQFDVPVTDIGLMHSKAASALLRDAVASCDDGGRARWVEARKARARAGAMRLAQPRFRVGTPYQLLQCALAGPRYTQVLADSARSVFVLDELHAYDPQRFGWLLAAMRLWEELGGRVGITSATLAPQMTDLIRSSLTQPVAVIEAVPSERDALRRHRLRVGTSDLLEDTAWVAAASARVTAGESCLVIVNQVRRAQMLHAAFQAELADHDLPVDLLHSRFSTRDRSGLENRLRDRYRTGGDRHRGVVVATQAAEVSLDVDFDFGVFDAAPLEALLQRFGRVNRISAREPADVHVHPVTPDWNGNVFPYAAGAVAAAWAALADMDGLVVRERDVDGWLSAVYGSEWGQGWLTETVAAREQFEAWFLDFSLPFHSRSHLEEKFAELFEGNEVVAVKDADEYGRLFDENPLLAAELLIPVSSSWVNRLRSVGRVDWRKDWRVAVVDVPYSSDSGLLLEQATERRVPDSAVTIL